MRLDYIFNTLKGGANKNMLIRQLICPEETIKQLVLRERPQSLVLKLTFSLSFFQLLFISVLNARICITCGEGNKYKITKM